MGLDWAERNNLLTVLLLAESKEMSNALCQDTTRLYCPLASPVSFPYNPQFARSAEVSSLWVRAHFFFCALGAI
jgi:hypothetical protein